MKLICINCPRGCHLEVRQENGEVIVTGNSCPRGVTYATDELIDPKRTLTTTVAIDSLSHSRLPVMTSAPIPKDKLMEVMADLKGFKAKCPVRMGDVIVKGIAGLPVDLIASRSIKE